MPDKELTILFSKIIETVQFQTRTTLSDLRDEYSNIWSTWNIFSYLANAFENSEETLERH